MQIAHVRSHLILIAIQLINIYVRIIKVLHIFILIIATICNIIIVILCSVNLRLMVAESIGYFTGSLARIDLQVIIVAATGRLLASTFLDMDLHRLRLLFNISDFFMHGRINHYVRCSTAWR